MKGLYLSLTKQLDDTRNTLSITLLPIEMFLEFQAAERVQVFPFSQGRWEITQGWLYQNVVKRRWRSSCGSCLASRLFPGD